MLLVQDLRRWCAVASRRHALRWEGLERLGHPDQADLALRRAEALDRAGHVLRVYG